MRLGMAVPVAMASAIVAASHGVGAFPMAEDRRPDASPGLEVAVKEKAMTTSAETHYSAIANRLVQGLPQDFVEAAIYAELEEGTGTVYICHRDRSGRLNLLHEPRFSGDLYEIIDAFREVWVQSGQASWSVLSFSLQPSGRFSADFGYEDVTDHGALDQRFSDWQSRTFPGETLQYESW